MRKETFIDELAETIDRLWDDAPPRIVLHGWWWKRYIPFFKRQQKVIDNMWIKQWENGGRKRHREHMEVDKDYQTGFNTCKAKAKSIINSYIQNNE